MNIVNVINKRYCLGCGLCASDIGENKIRMVKQGDGFIIPVPQEGFDGEVQMLREYCPGITVKFDRPLRTEQEKMYGRFLELKVAYANNQRIRFQGSSGGLITAILCGLLEKGEIDGVMHAGASSVFPLETEGKFSETVKEIIENAGSRYAPCSVLKDFKKILKTKTRIAVVGKPCDISAIYQYLKLYPKYAKNIFCTISFMCMGLPSQNATYRLLRELGADKKQIKKIKYRGHGWPGCTEVTTTQDRIYKCSYNDSWGNILGRDVLFRCKICPDGWGSFADISSGDAWYTDGNGPIFDEKSGRSLLFVRTLLGKEIIDKLSEKLTIKDYNIQELPIIQRSQHERKNRVWASYLTIKLSGDRLLCYKGLGIWSRMFKGSTLGAVRSVYGLIKRMCS
jgi:coenzyme F420 hydrogenase subunit beta